MRSLPPPRAAPYNTGAARPTTDSPWLLRSSSANKGFLAPERRAKPSQSWLKRFWNTQIVAADKRPGNLNIAWGVGIFATGVIFARTIAADVLVPAM